MKPLFLLSPLVVSLLAGCSVPDPQLLQRQRKTQEIHGNLAHGEAARRAVIASSPGAWLAGPSVQLADPLHPALNQKVVYHPTQSVSLSEVASWVTQRAGIAVDISELQAPTSLETGKSAAVSNPSQGGQTANRESMWSMQLNYEGSLAGLLDAAANKAGAWWRMADGRVIFYRSLSKTFYLPVVARKFSGDSSITTNGASGSGTSASGSALLSTSGVSASSSYTVDLWGEIEKTAKAVAGSAQIATNPASGSITVTGTPSQVRQVEDWVKSLVDQLGQQVAITIRIFNVRISREDNYAWSPSIIYKSGGAILSTLTGGSVPPVASSLTAASLAFSATSPTSAYSGSDAALEALSSLGEVVEARNQTLITLNGQPVPLQMANTQSYIKEASVTSLANAGSTASLKPEDLTTGFTGIFLPRIANGKVILGMALTSSVNNGFRTFSTNGLSVQTKNVDAEGSQHSVSLTPGDALLLTGLAHDTNSSNKSGVGSPDMPLLGGGIALRRGQILTGIVVTARIL